MSKMKGLFVSMREAQDNGDTVTENILVMVLDDDYTIAWLAFNELFYMEKDKLL